MFAIAIDGPAGAGKSSVARAAASALGFAYVDTGAMYRAIALYMLENHIPLEEPAAVAAIRTEAVSIATSRWVAHVPQVRQFLLDLQRDLAKRANVVMDGRDIGTVILPGAQLKVFLTASAEERARRRALQLEQAGEQACFQAVLEEVNRRDAQDAPQLEQLPPDGVVLDTTGLSFEQVVERLTDMARERMDKEEKG